MEPRECAGTNEMVLVLPNGYSKAVIEQRRHANVRWGGAERRTLSVADVGDAQNWCRQVARKLNKGEIFGCRQVGEDPEPELWMTERRASSSVSAEFEINSLQFPIHFT